MFQRVQGDSSTKPRYEDQGLGREYRKAWGAELTAWESGVEGWSGGVLSEESGHKSVNDWSWSVEEKVVSVESV